MSTFSEYINYHSGFDFIEPMQNTYVNVAKTRKLSVSIKYGCFDNYLN